MAQDRERFEESRREVIDGIVLKQQRYQARTGLKYVLLYNTTHSQCYLSPTRHNLILTIKNSSIVECDFINRLTLQTFTDSHGICIVLLYIASRSHSRE